MIKTNQIKGINSCYKRDGNGKKAFVLLHGWGQNKEMFDPMYRFLVTQKKTVISVDFPGFGNSSEPTDVYGVREYAEWLQALLLLENIETAIFVGHSFGCRVAYYYTANGLGQVEKLLMTGAAGVKPKRSLQYYFKVYTYKTMKVLLPLLGMKHVLEYKQKHAGSSDYQSSTPTMKGILSRVVNEDLTPLFSKINSPTLLVFGENDDATPLSDGKLMEKKLHNAKLHVYENEGHYAYWNQSERFLIDAATFFADELESEVW